ncbi:MAG: undecaprenyl-diphosphate phosphatase [Planctomycetota bacterium]
MAIGTDIVAAASSGAMSWWQAAILGLVEGITEYLPISSTGHLILTASLLGLDEDPAVKPSVDAFNIVVQGGAILAVLGLYRERVLQMIRGLLGKDRAGLRLFALLVVAFLPAAILGVPLNDFIEAKLFHPGPVLAALALGGVYMMVLDRWKVRPMRQEDRAAEEAGHPIDHGKDITNLSFRSALVVGLLQAVAMWPGTSRSMMTITGGVLVGLRPRQAAEFSFLLGLPTLGGATVFKLYKTETGEGPGLFEMLGVAPIAIGVLVATVSAAIAVKWLVGFLTRHGLAAFGWYRLGLCAVLGGMIATGQLQIGPAPQDDGPQETEGVIE